MIQIQEQLILILNHLMLRSVSQTRLGEKQLERSYSKQCIYVNEQSIKKTQKNSFSTIFHSPFKDGRKNKDYANPSFMSSDLFYPKQYIQQKNNTPKKAIIHTQSQNKQLALYNQRMKKSASFKDFHQRIRQNSRSLQKKFIIRQGQRQKSSKRRELKTVNPPQRLQNQLSLLINYRRNRQLRQSNRQNSRNLKNEHTQPPIYLQQNRKDITYEQMCVQKRKNQLQQWMDLTTQLSQLKKEIKKQLTQQENIAVGKSTKAFNQYQNIRQKNSRRNAQILANILKQQIRDNELKKVRQTSKQKQKKWKYF